MALPRMPELREASASDARSVAALIRRSFRKQVDLLELRRSECPEYVGFETADRVRHRMQRGHHVLVADVAGRLVGTVTFGAAIPDSHKGEIARLAVLPPHRGTGLGQALMGVAEAELGQFGATVAEISIVAKFNRLRSYYEAMGYKATRQQRFDALPFDVLFMEKRIP
jgi:GNAT superfamily N-acetyltransferase